MAGELLKLADDIQVEHQCCRTCFWCQNNYDGYVCQETVGEEDLSYPTCGLCKR